MEGRLPAGVVAAGSGVRYRHAPILLIAEAGDAAGSIRRDPLSPALLVCPVPATGIIQRNGTFTIIRRGDGASDETGADGFLHCLLREKRAVGEVW